MKTLNDFTPEIRNQIPKYIEKALDFGNTFDKESSIKYIHEIYKIAKYDPPIVIFANTLLMYRAFWEILFNKDLKDDKTDKTLQKEIQKKKGRTHSLFLCKEYARGYLAFYHFVSKQFKIKHDNEEKLDILYNLINKAGISCCWFTLKLVLVLKLPKVQWENQLIHSTNSAAVNFDNKEKYYYWKGVKVSKKLIETPEKITKKDLEKNTNAEERRAYIEKLGASKYFGILSSGKGLETIDEDTDEQGFPMKLLSFDFEGTKIQVLECTCPSTRRVYNIYPPSQNCSNVWAAKADTFNGQNLYYRHGDVGLVKEGGTPKKPLQET